MCSHELLSLDGFGSAVPSFQMHQVFRGILKRVPPDDAAVHGRPLYDDQRRHIPLAGLASPIVHGVPRRAAGSSHRGLRWPRGRLQPNLRHGGLPFSAARLATGAIWGLWHLPLWFTRGAGREATPFPAFAALAVLLSFWLSALYRAGGCAFSCCLLHALANTLIGVLSLSSISLVMAAVLALTGLSLAALRYSAPTRAPDRSAC